MVQFAVEPEGRARQNGGAEPQHELTGIVGEEGHVGNRPGGGGAIPVISDSPGPERK